MKIEKSWKIPSWIPKIGDRYEKKTDLIEVTMTSWDRTNIIVYYRHSGEAHSMEMYRFLRFVDRKVFSREWAMPKDLHIQVRNRKRMIRLD
jgi:hypothetical protein